MSRTSLASSAGHSSGVSARKPKALRAGARLAVFAPASPGSDAAEERGSGGVSAARFFGGTQSPEKFPKAIFRRRQRSEEKNLSAR